MRIESFDGQKESEEIVAVWRQHIWVLSKTALAVILLIVIGSMPLAFWSPSWGAKFLLFFVAVAGLYFLLGFFLWFNTIYILTDLRVMTITQQRFMIRKINEIPLSNIQNVAHVKKGIFQMIFDFGNVEVQTAGAVTGMNLRNVEHPYKVQQKILTAEKKGL